jgi:hydroxyacylglutathione hydrolase
LPTPGHQEEAISVYDPRTKWLLTGDTFYPGYLYVKNWDDYKYSIARLVAFSKTREVQAVLGAHIEMQEAPGEFYPIGTLYQPHEARLALTPQDLAMLDSALQDAGNAKEIVFDKFIVAPLNMLQKMISNIARWIVQ